MVPVFASSASIRVPMAGLEVVFAPAMLETLLGSCVGIAIWAPDLPGGALAHVMLPECKGNVSAPGRCVDSAIPAMVQRLEQLGAQRSRLMAKLAGGANMFQATPSAQEVGRRNIEKTRELLEQWKIPLTAEHVGGHTGRVIFFDTRSGAVRVQVGLDIAAVL